MPLKGVEISSKTSKSFALPREYRAISSAKINYTI